MAWTSRSRGGGECLLICSSRAALRRLPALLVPQPGDLGLELLDQQHLVADLGAIRSSAQRPQHATQGRLVDRRVAADPHTALEFDLDRAFHRRSRTRCRRYGDRQKLNFRTPDTTRQESPKTGAFSWRGCGPILVRFCSLNERAAAESLRLCGIGCGPKHVRSRQRQTFPHCPMSGVLNLEPRPSRIARSARRRQK